MSERSQFQVSEWSQSGGRHRPRAAAGWRVQGAGCRGQGAGTGREQQQAGGCSALRKECQRVGESVMAPARWLTSISLARIDRRLESAVRFASDPSSISAPCGKPAMKPAPPNEPTAPTPVPVTAETAAAAAAAAVAARDRVWSAGWSLPAAAASAYCRSWMKPSVPRSQT